MSDPFIELKANMSPLVIVREFGRDIPLECERCGRVWPLRLYSDEVLDDDACNRLLDEWLIEHGWTIVHGLELCPDCGPRGNKLKPAAGVKPDRPSSSARFSPGKGGP